MPANEPDPRTDDLPSWSGLAAAVRAELVDRGPLDSSALLFALAGRGLAAVDEPDIEELVDRGEIAHVVQLDIADGSVFVALDALLQGRTFTHRLTTAEIADHGISIATDLDPLMMLFEAAPFDQFEDGTPAEPAFIGAGADVRPVLKVPPAALSGRQSGDLIGLDAAAGGLRITAVQNISAAPDGLTDQVAELAAAADDSGPIMLDDLVYQLCLASPDLFTQPLAPLSELLVDWGLESFGGHVAPAGFDFESWGVAAARAELAETYDITEEQADAVRRMSRYFNHAVELIAHLDSDVATDLQPITVGEAGEAPPELANPAVAEAFFWETVGIGVEEAGVMLALTDSWNSGKAARIRPALAWLQGKSHERLGETSDAEIAFERSLALDPFFGASLVDLARYAADRGDATRAVALLERAGFTDEDALLANLRPFLPVERADVGRNDPCWCGSGRKYKRCHLGKAELSETDRARWLRQKMVLFTHDPPQAALLMEMAVIRTAHLDIDPASAFDDPAVLDVTLFEGGVLDSFARTRGNLLPAEERALLKRWSTTERSVFEVADISPGRRVTLRDLRKGNHLELTDELEGAALSRSMHRGDLLLTRLLAVGDSVTTFGVREPVEPHRLDDTLGLLDLDDEEALDAVAVMAAMSFRFGPAVRDNKGA